MTSQGGTTLEVCIIGGGIVGASTAFYLTHPATQGQSSTSLPPSKLTIVDSCGIARCASGFSGGFMAEDWHGHSTSSLARHSFRLHRELAEKYEGTQNWGYRKLSALSLKLVNRSSGSSNSKSKSQARTDLDWLNPDLEVIEQSEIGNESTCAQVHPRLLTEHLIKMCESVEVSKTTKFQVVRATAKSIKWDPSDPDQKISPSTRRRGRLLALDNDNQQVEIAFDELVLAAGPWSGALANQLFPPEYNHRLKSVNGMRAHSIVVSTREPISAHALFTHLLIRQPNATKAQWTEPEFYPRPDNTIYICGAGDDEPLPERPTDVNVNQKAIESLKAQAKAVIMSGCEKDLEQVLAEQACYLPVGQPLVGRLCPGVLIGTGLGCWGITLGPGTGQVLASMILNQSSTVKSPDLSQLSPI
ncbi:hypothetical protein CROQUDRAFT_42288 [Cronartium quercuum f. sp. fusiforme G11]|uniref:FAD dependent oxidoreductase domain-containing protein n=1 Tax=Cronartium quercuum f. sp. fusiforme G11 TaxID=708437 RepID=A0A9P6NIY1_9BASI|nr:hypothetical protein CROQUDRAFT_42288 [Cronartium quercuum f. sp. fusiforme G11]